MSEFRFAEIGWLYAAWGVLACGLVLSALELWRRSLLDKMLSPWMQERLVDTDWKKLSDDQIVDLLTQIKGVGQWSAQMILMFTLSRPDVFPIDDLGIRNAIVKCYRLRSKDKSLERRLMKIAEPWRPFRTLACCYLWRWYDGQTS